MENENLRKLKKLLMFEEDGEGMIRQGLDMEKYAHILFAEDETELNKIIENLIDTYREEEE